MTNVPATPAREAQPRTIKDLLESGVLYADVQAPVRQYTNEVTTTLYVIVPSTIDLYCADEKCLDSMEWDVVLEYGNRIENVPVLFCGHEPRIFDYRCRHSGRTVTFVLQGTNEGVVTLIGRQPRAAFIVNDALREALNEHDLYFYKNALESRVAGLGIGALAYMRRVVENEMDRLLELLEQEVVARGLSPEALETVRRLRGTHQFQDKAAAADAILPDSFFPGAANPFTRLHSLVSDGVHNLDDVESCEAFDEARELFELLFEKLQRDAAARKLYDEKLARLTARRSNRQPPPGA